MIYGGGTVQLEIEKIIRQVESEKGIHIIYGATIGSAAKGLNHQNSDIDVYFLYMMNSFPHKKYQLFSEEETSFKIKWNGKGKIDEVSFWEITSALEIPWLQRKELLKDKEYDILETFFFLWTSCYTYDPYGLQKKTEKIVNQLIGYESQLCIYRKNLEELLQDSGFTIKKYMRALYYAIAVEYALNHENRIVPSNIYSLMIEFDRKKRGKILSELNRIRAQIECMHIQGTGADSNAEVIEVDNFMRDYIIQALDKTKQFSHSRLRELNYKEKNAQLYYLISSSVEEMI